VTQVRFVSRPGFGEVRRFTLEQSFRSLSTQAVHGFGWGVAAFGLIAGAPVDIWLPPAVIGVFFGIGLFSLLVQWWIYGRHPERLVETITADERGLLIEGPESQIRQAWSLFRDAHETRDVFMLTAVRTMSQFLGKRGASESELEAFRGYLRGAGLLRSRQTWARGIAGFGIGFILALGLPFAFGIARFA
jgi:hypothetical protein